MRRRLYYKVGIWGFIILLIITIGFGYYSQIEQSNLKLYEVQLESSIHKAEEYFEKSFFKDDILIKGILEIYDGKQEETLPDNSNAIESLDKESFSILIYQEQRLVYWSNNQVLLDAYQLEQIQQKSKKALIELDNGYYEVYQKWFIGPKGEYNIVGLIPIVQMYEVNSDYLQNDFVQYPHFPENLKVSISPTDHNIESKDGDFLFGLEATGKLTSINQQLILFLLLGLSTILFLVIIHIFSAYLSRRISVWLGMIFLLGSVGFLRYASWQYNFQEWFSSLVIVKDVFSLPFMGGVLADLLINSLLIFWISVFFHFYIKLKPNVLWGHWKKWFSTFLISSLIIGMLISIIRVFRSLVLETNLIINFDNILYFNIFSILATLGVLFLMTALFLFTHRMMSIVEQFKLSWLDRIVALGFALMAVFPIIWYMELGIAPVAVFLLGTFYILIAYLFIESALPGLTWSIMWITLFSAFGAALLSQFNTQRDKERQLVQAKQLAEPRDTVAEEKLHQLGLSLAADDSLELWLSTKDIIDQGLVRTRIDPQFIEDNYLFNKFNYNILALSKGGRYAPIAGQKFRDVLPFFDNEDLYDKTSRTNVFSLQTGGNQFSYAVRQHFKADSTKNASDLLVIFSPSGRKQPKVYSELLVSEEDVPFVHNEFDYRVIREGQIINQQIINQQSFPNEKLLTYSDQLSSGEWRSMVTKSRIDLLYRAANENLVLISNQTGGLSKAFSLFSYLFIVSVLLLLVLNGINFIFRCLPEPICFDYEKAPSFRNRIQMAVVVQTVCSFIFIGAVTVSFFQRYFNNYHEKRFTRKINRIIDHFEHNINFFNQYAKSTRGINLKSLAAAISDIDDMDINVFDLDGRLIASSAEYIYDKGIIAPLMSASAFHSLKHKSDLIYRQEEELGDLKYQAAYIPITGINQQLLGYLNIPYYSKGSEQRNTVYELIGTMLNVYVFLLMIAGISAIFVSRSITKPLEQIGESLKIVKLGKNKPIQWKGQDEIGHLVLEYNKMISKLEENTEMLKISEREGAWREMAKQVAHEIKNPLTPMKLSIQYLMHAYKANPKNAEPLLNRVSDTLIEQIEGLSRIASEFSNFAKMPKAKNEVFNLNELLSSVFQLFNKNHPANIQIALSLPDESYEVFADRNHLMRVFNNLVKNGIQAIPDNAIGQIKIKLIPVDSHYVQVKIADNGTGISKAIQEKVFFPNFTTKNSGMGLGLAISKNIIDNLDGQIYFRTEEGKGTTFTVELPVYMEEEQLV